MDFESAPDLTPDPEWLLQSGENDPELLAELLAAAFAPQLLELGLRLGFEAETAERLVVSSLSAAAQNTHRYARPHSARAWLIGYFLQAALKEAPLSNKPPVRLSLAQKTACLLHTNFKWPAAEAAEACGIWVEEMDFLVMSMRSARTAGSPENDPVPRAFPPETLQRLASLAALNAKSSVRRHGRMNRLKEIGLIGATILTALFVFWGATRLLPEEDQAPIGGATPIAQLPTQTPGPTPTPLWLENVSYVIEQGDTLSRIASRAGISLDELRSINDIHEPFIPQPGDPLWVSVPDGPPTEAPPSPAPNLAHLEPLSVFSSMDEVRHRLRQGRNYWRTLQADYQLVTYLERNQAADELQFYRFRVWISQPYYSSELFGKLSSRPDLRHVIRYGRNYNSAVGYSSSYLDPAWDLPTEVLIYSPVLREMIFPDGPDLLVEGLGESQIIGEDQVAERQALVIEWQSPEGRLIYRYWVDVFSGILMRRQTFDPQRNRLISDMIATSILYDLRIPNSIFDPRIPWKGSYAENDTNRTVPFDSIVPAPTNAFFEPGES